MSETKPRKRAKGGGRKPLDPEIRQQNRQASKEKYRSSRKQFTCLLSTDTYKQLQKLRASTGLSYATLLSRMIAKWKTNPK